MKSLFRRFATGLSFAWALAFRPYERPCCGIPYKRRASAYLGPLTCFAIGWSVGGIRREADE